MPNEAIVANPDVIANKGMGLNSGSFPNYRTGLDFYECPYHAVGPNLATVKINKMPDDCSGSNFHIFAPDIILRVIQRLLMINY